MPVYVYKCKSCGKKFEKVLSIKEESSKTKCECGADADKVPVLSNFHLKGNGWYKDGYNGPSNKGRKGG